MPTYSETKTYSNGNALTEAMLDAGRTSRETFLNTTKLDSANIQAGGIATSNLANNCVDETKLASSVAGNGLAGGAGTALSVNVDGSTIEISADALQVKDGGITLAKLAALNYVVASADSGTASTTSTSFTDISGQSISITTHGRPVVVGVFGNDGSTSDFTAAGQGYVAVVRDSSILSYHPVSGGAPAPVSVVTAFDPAPSAGSHTYKLQFRNVSGGASATNFRGAKMYVYEL